MVRQSRTEWKADYIKRLTKQLSDCERCFIVNVDNVRSKQMQQIRKALRGDAVVALGKNTLMRKVVNSLLARNSALEKILPHIRENVGFVFTKGDLCTIREKIEANRVEAPAKAGTIAPCDVIVPAQNTGLGPEKTQFFQALNIPTKISRGSIEILNNIDLIKKDDKVGMSEATLLSMLKIYPFTYGLSIKQVFDQGTVYDPSVLDITPDIILEKFNVGVRNLIAVSLLSGYTTAATVPYLISQVFKDLLAISTATDYVFEQAAQIREYLADPSKFAVADPVSAKSAETTKSSEKPAAAAAPAPAPAAEESDSGSDLGMGLFD